tara:strand:+ start:1126 stop:1767 length:642 start_codon:yes stop_codon:yes gene_type:complete
MTLLNETASQNRIFIISQPKAGTYLLANILLQLGYQGGSIDTFEGIKHCDRGKVEIYPYPGTRLFNDARIHPEKYRLYMGFQRTVDTIYKGEFGVGHVLPKFSAYPIREFKKIFISRPLDEIEQSLIRWDKFSGRSPSNIKDVLDRAKEMLKWNNYGDSFEIQKIFKITFDDIKNKNIQKINALQKYLDIDPIHDSQRLCDIALSKDSITKVK